MFYILILNVTYSSRLLALLSFSNSTNQKLYYLYIPTAIMAVMYKVLFGWFYCHSATLPIKSFIIYIYPHDYNGCDIQSAVCWFYFHSATPPIKSFIIYTNPQL